MTEVSLRTGLAAVHVEMVDRVAAVECDLREHAAQHDGLLRQLRELNEQLSESRETRRLLEQELEAVKSATARSIVQWSVKQLGHAAAAIGDAERILMRLEQLRLQREELLSGDPELEGELQQYRQFEAIPADLLAGLPDYHRQRMLAAHEQLRERLAPYLAFEALERQLPTLDAIRVEMIFAQRPDRHDFYLVMPFTAPPPEPMDDSGVPPARPVHDAVMDLMLHLALEAEWRLSDLEERSWCGYSAVVLTGEYEGSGDPCEAAEANLQKLADAGITPGGIPLFVELAPVAYESWLAGLLQDALKLRATEERVEQLKSPEPVDATQRAPFRTALGDGWYYGSDLMSWDRPLKLVAESQWNVNARRLRTLLIRMVSNGLVGDNKVAKERLWAGLPEPHSAAMQEGVARLIDRGVLAIDPPRDSEQEQVSINPQLLGQLEVLVNRDVNEFWADIISEAAAAEPDEEAA